MKKAFRTDCLLRSRSTLLLSQFTMRLRCCLLSIIFKVWLLLTLWASSSVAHLTEASPGRLSR